MSIHDDKLKDPQPDSSVGCHLRKAYWDLIQMLQIRSSVFAAWRMEHVKDPMFAKYSNANEKDRSGRLGTALSGGNAKGVIPPMTWKRFVEGLAIIKVTHVEMSVAATRGNYGSRAIHRVMFMPRNELLDQYENLDDPALEVSSMVATADNYRNTQYTANHVMRHPLLKIFWGLQHEFEIDFKKWRDLSSIYVNNPENCPALTNRRNDKRNNLQDAIRRTRMISWKRFIEALKAIAVNELECVFKCYFDNRSPLEVSFTVDVKAANFRSVKDEK